MEADYNHLNIFESATVVMASIGIVLISSLSFLSLPPSQQTAVEQSFMILDVREDFIQQTETIKLVFDFQQDFYD